MATRQRADDEARITGAPAVEIRPLEERDLDSADEIMRIAFGTYLKAPDPIQVFGDSDYVHTRFRAAPDSAFAAELDGEVVGSNFATRWGSFGFFGPLTVRVDLWDRGIATHLVEPVVNLFDSWGLGVSGLFTFPESTKHLGLYQKFGFWPDRLTPLLAKPVESRRSAAADLYSDLAESERPAALDACARVADGIHPGLDLGGEITAAQAQGLGDTVLLEEGGDLVGFAVCHVGAATEAGSDTCFVKFGAVVPGKEASARFGRLLDSCEGLAAARGASRFVAGVNTGRDQAHRALLERGLRPFLNGIQMLRPGGPAYNRPESFVIDDLR